MVIIHIHTQICGHQEGNEGEKGRGWEEKEGVKGREWEEKGVKERRGGDEKRRRE